MKQGVSSLNPYAAAYIPLSKRGANDRTYARTIESNEAIWSQNPQHVPQNQLLSKAYIECDARVAKQVGQGVYATKSDHYYGSSSQTLNEVAEKQMSDEEFDMDLEYLRMTFTGISNQSLTDVYLANKGDLEASIDMLNQLESDMCIPLKFDDVQPHGYTESSESLPDTLDIGDVSELPFKLKQVPSVAEASSKGSDNSVIS